MTSLKVPKPADSLGGRLDEWPGAAGRRRALVDDLRHDLKNARLAAVCSLNELAEYLQDGTGRVVLASLEAALGEILGCSAQCLELFTLDGDGVGSLPKPEALDPILREVELARRSGAEAAGISIRVVPTGAVAVVDHGLLQRCIGNLVTNAIEHSGGRWILVGVRRRGSGCAIEVRDNGRGIDPEALCGMDGRRWFDGSDRGLGLWIASSLARILGGELSVRAQVGRGTRFQLALPGPVSWAPGSMRAARPGHLRLDGRLVVLLDDDAGQLASTRLAFQRRGATVITAQSQIEFWNEIEQLPLSPDICVLDFVLGRSGRGGGDGLQLTSVNDLAWLKKRFGDRTKIVILTAYPAHPQLKGAGDVPIFEKPLDNETMDAVVTLLIQSEGLNGP